MRKVRIEAFGDGSASEGSFAVVRLRGVDLPPDPVVYVLHPADKSIAVPDGWPAGSHIAFDQRSRDDGFELIVGPDIAGNRQLVAGAEIEMRLPELGLFGQFQWPRIEAQLPPRRRNIVVARSGREARGDTQRSPMQPPTAAVSRTEVADDAFELVREAPQEGGESQRAAATILQQKNVVVPLGAVVPAGNLATALKSQPADEVVAVVIAEPQNNEPELYEPLDSEEATTMPSNDNRTQRPGRIPEVQPGGRANISGLEPVQQADDAELYHSARGGSSPRSPGHQPYASDGRIAGLLALGLVVLGALLYNAVPKAPTTTPVAAASAAAAPNAASAQPQFSAASPLPSAAEGSSALYDTLSVGLTSPKGASARNVGALKSLETATPMLLDLGPNRDTDESMFWLKRYVVSTLGDERMMRALTKIGTLYAEPSKGAPDFVRARYTWELASAAGDPVAMCFLGLLHENGLGVPVGRPSALQWFERAKQAGGCSGVDEAIARVK